MTTNTNGNGGTTPPFNFLSVFRLSLSPKLLTRVTLGVIALLVINALFPVSLWSFVGWFVFALLAGAILIYLVAVALGSNVPFSAAGIMSTLSVHSGKFWFLVLIIWLTGFGGLWHLITDPLGFGGKVVSSSYDTTVGAVVDNAYDKPDLPEWLMPDRNRYGHPVPQQAASGAANYWLDLAIHNLATAKKPRWGWNDGQVSIRFCEGARGEHIAAMLKNPSQATAGPLSRQTLAVDGVETGLSLVYCQLGGQQELVWGEPAAYTAHKLIVERSVEVGRNCGPTDNGWRCIMAPASGQLRLPLGEWVAMPGVVYTRDVSETGVQQCIRWKGNDEFANDYRVLVDHSNPSNRYDQNWVEWNGQASVEAIAFESTSLSPVPIYFGFFRRNPDGSCSHTPV